MTIFDHRLLKYILYPFSVLYGLIVRVRNFCYDFDVLRTTKIENCRVISVGNISVGGTGKTPVIKYLALYLKKKNLNVAVLSRGYGRKSIGTRIVSDGNTILCDFLESGDEPMLLARQLKGVPVVVEADRSKGARFIVEQFRPDVILLDDGYQHRRLARDFNIALVDASVGFGSEFLLPAGFLREPVSSLNRADLIWLTRVDQAETVQPLIHRIGKVADKKIIKSVHHANGIVSAKNGRFHAVEFIQNKKVVLFSGIANTDSFENTVTSLGAELLYHARYSDHHLYNKQDLKSIEQKSRALDAEMILTTEKDFVKLAGLTDGWFNLYYVSININIIGEMDLEQTGLCKIFNKSIKQ